MNLNIMTSDFVAQYTSDMSETLHIMMLKKNSNVKLQWSNHSIYNASYFLYAYKIYMNTFFL